ncbi:MAG: DUF1501 domain-containing protein [Chthoniobacteraceae bacterium]
MNPTLLSRRDILRSAAAGFGWFAFNGMHGANAAPINPLAPVAPHFRPRAKRVIFLFMSGGPSQVDTFDYKPELTKKHNVKVGTAADGPVLFQSPWEFRARGKSGLPVSDLLPHIAQHADDLCVINSMHTDHNAHPQAILQMNTGSFLFARPSVGSWVTYGLGTENQNLPGFITISPDFAGGGALKHSSGFLPAACAGTPIGNGNGNGTGPQSLKDYRMPFMQNAQLDAKAQRDQLDLLAKLNAEHLRNDPTNDAIEGIMQSAELAFKMQREAPEVMSIAKEPPKTLELYGIGDGKPTDHFGRACLMARRFCEAGVRFVQVNHAFWDDHTEIVKNHPKHALETDQPVGALLADLKQRGLLDDTLVLWGGEFGRPPLLNKNKGRDHNNVGFSMFLAGGGTRGGIRYGSTDETGARAEQDKVHLHDLHATMLHLLGLDHERLTYRYAGRDFRLTDVSGDVVKGLLA